MGKDAIKIVWLSLCSLTALFVLTKLMGKRQMSQLTLFDYIAGISIGSMAAEVACHPEPESWLGLISMAIYGVAALLINVLNTRSLKIRKVFLGVPLVLYDNGQLYLRNLKKAKLDLNELMMECRVSGYFDLRQLQLILMEVNGKLSFLPNSQYRPATPEDLSLNPSQERPAVAVIMDGVAFPSRLQAIGLNESWLEKQLHAQGYVGAEQILLATVSNDKLAVWPKQAAPPKEHYV
ncbi:MAG: DUF421 domain-containing protein [Clostridiales bacterium]|nr:DUF421 domain-containing protein [Clostridiales bacterium]